VQCFLSRSEPECANVRPGGEVTITVVREDVVFAPGTECDGLCQLRGLESGELLFRDGRAIAMQVS
jgi:hypothetical protein